MECEQFCTDCADIDDSQYEVLTFCSTLHWYCMVCYPKITRCISVEQIIANIFMQLEENIEKK